MTNEFAPVRTNQRVSNAICSEPRTKQERGKDENEIWQSNISISGVRSNRNVLARFGDAGTRRRPQPTERNIAGPDTDALAKSVTEYQSLSNSYTDA